MSAGAQAVVAVDATGQHASLSSGGAATFADANLVIDPQAGDYARATFYPVLSAAGGISGTAVATSTNPILEPWISAGSNVVGVTLVNTQAKLGSYATTPQGTVAGAALDRLRPVATGDLSVAIRELSALDDPRLDRALAALAGEIHAATGRLGVIDGESLMDLVREETGLRADVGVEGRRVWSQVRHATEGQLWQSAVGVDYGRARGWLFGGGGAYANASLTLDGVDESSHYTSWRGFGHVGYRATRSIANVGLSVARSEYDIRRRFEFTATAPDAFGGQPLFGGIRREAQSRPTEVASDVWGEWSVRAQVGEWSLNPVMGARYGRYSRAAWSESGAGSLSLSAGDDAFDSLQWDAGLRASRAIGRFRPMLAGEYRRQVDGSSSGLVLRLLDSDEGSFLLDGNAGRDSFTSRAGLTYRAGGVGASLVYEMRHGGTDDRHSVRFGVSF
jgi:hypothetical protein